MHSFLQDRCVGSPQALAASNFSIYIAFDTKTGVTIGS